MDTSASITSPYVQAEIAMAQALGGKFLALVVDGMTLPANVDETQILDITVSGADGPRHLVEKVLVRRA